MQAKFQEQLSPADAEVILARLPERIREAPIARAAEIEYPVEAVVEMAIASFLDAEALGGSRLPTRTRTITKIGSPGVIVISKTD
jgi:hypothetical protein